MTVRELHEALSALLASGHGSTLVFASIDDEGNGYHSIDEVEFREPTMEYVDKYGWHDDLPVDDLVILW